MTERASAEEGGGRESAPGGLTLPEMRRLIAACDRFEREWREGLSPKVEGFLGDTAGRGREALLRGLMARGGAGRRARGGEARAGGDPRGVPPDAPRGPPRPRGGAPADPPG